MATEAKNERRVPTNSGVPFVVVSVGITLIALGQLSPDDPDGNGASVAIAAGSDLIATLVAVVFGLLSIVGVLSIVVGQSTSRSKR